ncbi:MAG: tyrosine-type recombinase/integrase [Candidatus Thermoplasmatota archaeon]|jgi:site-specific recombinase XerC|nr:tyrosine-type recombinase/integrase [Candidatus Thermoplasmatota archaeon]
MGLRLQELTDLKVSYVDFQKGINKVRGKGQNKRQTNLPDEAAGALREYLL